MKRMGGSTRGADKKAVALGRDMLKRPSRTNVLDIGGGKSKSKGGGMSASASMSILKPRRPASRNKLALKDSFALFLENNPQEEISRMTEHIVAAMKENVAGDLANETFATSMPPRAGRRRSNSLTNADIPTWKGYAPVSSSRRGSRAGNEQSSSMKMTAQLALAELGELSDDSDFDGDFLELGLLETLGEETYEPVVFDD